MSAETRFSNIDGLEIACSILGKGSLFYNRFRGILDTWNPLFLDSLAGKNLGINKFHVAGWLYGRLICFLVKYTGFTIDRTNSINNSTFYADFYSTKIKQRILESQDCQFSCKRFDAEFSEQLMCLMDELESEDLKEVVFESARPEFFAAHVALVNIGDFPKGVSKTGLSISRPDIAKRLERAHFVSIASIRGCARGLISQLPEMGRWQY